jgi:divalent metal cation (Fe/Co/Zn/Cd) transporter
MSLKEAHDIGEELQKKIERIPEVERVFSRKYFVLI